MKSFGLLSSLLGLILFSIGIIFAECFITKGIIVIILLVIYYVFFICNFIVFYSDDVYIIGILPFIKRNFKVEKTSIAKVVIRKTYSSRLTLKSVELYNFDGNRIRDTIINFLPFEEKKFTEFLESINIEYEYAL